MKAMRAFLSPTCLKSKCVPTARPDVSSKGTSSSHRHTQANTLGALPQVQAADEAAHLSAGSGSKASGGGGSGGGGVPMAAIIGVAAAAAAGAGVALGVAVAVACRRRRARRAEERTRAFEAVFSDPELELEEVAAEVRRAGCTCENGKASPSSLAPSLSPPSSRSLLSSSTLPARLCLLKPPKAHSSAKLNSACRPPT